MNLSAEFRDRYGELQLIGEGGFSQVYLGRDRLLGRPVAIKFLGAAGAFDDPLDVARFREEARIVASLRHANIVAIYGEGVEAGRPYLVFEYVDGHDLVAEIEERGQLPASEIARIARGVLEGLDCAHRESVVHRDLKPGNILLRAEDGRPMVTDFGLAKAPRRRFRTQAGIALGTPAYMSPEALLGGEVGPASDIYSLGCTLYECAAGRPPFVASTEMAVITAQIEQEPVGLASLRPDLPAGLVAVVSRCLAKDPLGRFPEAHAMFEALSDPEAAAARPQPIGVSARRAAIEVAAPPLPGATAIEDPRGPGPRREPTVSRVPDPRRERGLRGRKGLAVGTVAGVTALALAWTVWWGPAPARLTIVADGRGVIEVQTLDDEDGPVTVRALPVRGGAGTLVAGVTSSRRGGIVRLGGVTPGATYRLEVLRGSATGLWSREVEVPPASAAVVEWSADGPAVRRIELPAAGSAHGVLRLSGETASTSELGVRMGGSLVFEGPWPAGRLARGASIEVPLDAGLVARHPVQPALPVAAALLKRLPAVDPARIVAAIVSDKRHFENGIDLSRLLSAREMGPFALKVGPDAGLGVPTFDSRRESRRRRTPDGFIRTRIIQLLGPTGVWRDLARLTHCATGFFEDPAVPDHRKLALYHGLQRLVPLELVIRSQLDARTIEITPLTGSLVRVTHSLFACSDPRPTVGTVVPGLARQEAWATADYSTWRAAHIWARSSEFKALYPSADVPALAAFRALFSSSRMSSRLCPEVRHPDDRVVLEACVSFLGPAYYYEVTLQPDPEGPSPLRILLTHPGLPEWHQAMDGLGWTLSGLDGVLRTSKAKGRSILWGRIRASFPARLLPSRCLRLRLTYRHIPGATLEQLTSLGRLSFMRDVTLHIEGVAPPPGGGPQGSPGGPSGSEMGLR